MEIGEFVNLLHEMQWIKIYVVVSNFGLSELSEGHFFSPRKLVSTFTRRRAVVDEYH